MFSTITNTDFSFSTLSMSLLSSGTEDISLFTSPSFLASTSTVSVYTPIVIVSSISYLFSTPYSVQFQEYFQQIYLRENYTLNISPSLPCSTFLSEVISYSLSSYNGITLPTWMSIDSTTGLISGTTPFVSADSNFDFFVDSQIDSETELYQKWIRISVVNCEGSNQPNMWKNDPYCGDGVFMSYLNELWDDGNLINGDGWNSTWQIEFGYSCSLLPSTNFLTVRLI